MTTTSGLAWKIPGRTGDSPILGAGLYVDNEVGAAGSTGRGEANLYNLCSFLIVEQMRVGKSPKDAGMEALRRIKANTVEKRLLNGKGNPAFGLSFYVLNKKGEFAGVSMYQTQLRRVHRQRSRDAATASRCSRARPPTDRAPRARKWKRRPDGSGRLLRSGNERRAYLIGMVQR